MKTIKIKYINEEGNISYFTKGSHIIIVSPLQDKKTRHAYVLECLDTNKILIQMLTTSNKYNNSLLKINNKYIIVAPDFQIWINILDPNIKILKTKFDKINEYDIEKIKKIKAKEHQNKYIKEDENLSIIIFITFSILIFIIAVCYLSLKTIL